VISYPPFLIWLIAIIFRERAWYHRFAKVSHWFSLIGRPSCSNWSLWAIVRYHGHDSHHQSYKPNHPLRTLYRLWHLSRNFVLCKPCPSRFVLFFYVTKQLLLFLMEYAARCEQYRNHFHGHIIWPKVLNLCVWKRFMDQWKSIGKWRIASLGRCFYELSFSSTEDLKKVHMVHSYKINLGFLMQFTWSYKFHPNTLQQT
jgi:hypothetical protein